MNRKPIWGMADTGSNGATEETDKDKVVEVVNNHIYFYSEIERDKVLIMTKALKGMEARHLYEQQVYDRVQSDPIWLHLSSYGGYCYDALTGMDAIRSTIKNGLIVNTVVDGYCASAGTLLSVVGSRRYMNPAAYMLIHQLSSAMWGKFEELKDDMINMEALETQARAIYAQYTRMTDEQLQEVLKRDLWFDAAKCLECGLVDEIL